MKAKQKQIVNYVFMCVVLVAIVLVVVGMFVGQIVAKYEGALSGKSSEAIKLFDGDAWGVEEVGGKNVGVSNVFAIISFIVTLVGLAVLVVDGVLHNCLKKDIRIIRIVGAALALVGAVLVLVAGLVMANQCNDGSFNLSLGGVSLSKASFSAGAGVWLGFIGGLVGAVAGALPLLKQFD